MLWPLPLPKNDSLGAGPRVQYYFKLLEQFQCVSLLRTRGDHVVWIGLWVPYRLMVSHDLQPSIVPGYLDCAIAMKFCSVFPHPTVSPWHLVTIFQCPLRKKYSSPSPLRLYELGLWPQTLPLSPPLLSSLLAYSPTFFPWSVTLHPAW